MGALFFVACPADFSSFCDYFFFKTKIKGVEGVGPGSPELQTLSWGGGVGALFFSLALPAFLKFAILFLKTNYKGRTGWGWGPRGPSPRSDTVYPMSLQYIKPVYPFLGL